MSISGIHSTEQASCHSAESSEGFWESTVAVALASLNELRFHCNKAALLIRHKFQGLPAEYMDPTSDSFDWKEGSRGLCVLVDGLFGPREILEQQRQHLVEKTRQIDIKVPQVPHNGNCPVQTAVEPILHMVMDYRSHYPENPICLIGVSNGGRIIAELELALRDSPSSVKVSTIAGVMFGTRLIDTLKHTRLTHLALDPILEEELTFGSEDAQRRIRRQREPLPEAVLREFTYYAAEQDTHVWPLSSSLPDIGQGEVLVSVSGQTHCSLAPAIAEEQIMDCLQWFDRHWGSELISCPHSSFE